MAEEEWIAATQEGLGKLIAKPKMTEKYLKKPPFRFLHDIIMEVTRTTGFGANLYTAEESDAGNLGDKGLKVEFLNKAISCVCFALGEKIDVSANKIVAGLEADKTNAWLQKIHIAATTAVGQSEEAVQRVLAGESVAAPRKPKKAKEEEGGAPEAPPAGDDAAAAEEEARKAEEKRRRAKAREEKKRAEEEAARAAEEAAGAPPPAAPAAPEEDAEEAERRAKEEAKRKKEERRREEKRKQQAEEEERMRQQQEADAAAQQQAMFEAQQAQLAQEQAMQQQQMQQQMMAQQAAEEEQRRQMMMAQQHIPDDAAGDMPSAPGSAQAPQRPMADPGMQPGPDEIAARAEAMMQGQGAEDMGDRPGRPERPRTAGRKPPKVTSKVTTRQDEPGLTQGVAPPTIIAEGAKDDDDEDMFEAPVQSGMATGMPIKADDNAVHGKLVQDLLSEKKKAEEDARIRQEEEATREEVEEPGQKGIKMGKLKRRKEQATSGGEIDTVKLSEGIQQLCQAANPLGKSIDLVHQDIANMGKELDHWKQEYREASEQYQQEMKMTEELLQPLYQKIAELDDRIAEQKAKIRNSRSRISKNDLKIQGLLESVVMAK